MGKRQLFAWIIFLTLLGAVSLNGLVAAFVPAQDTVMVQTATGALQAEMRVSPYASRPGETLTIEIDVVNHGSQPAAPEIKLAVPTGLTFKMGDVPSSTTINVVDNGLTWRPVVPAGERRSFALPVRLDVVDLTRAERSLTAIFRNGAQTFNLSADYWIGIPPQATILGSETTSVGQAVQLFADIKGAGPFTQHWDLGDGRLFRAENPTVIYAAPGTYQVKVAVENPIGRVEATKVIDVIPDPAAFFVPDDNTAGVGQPIQFENVSGGVAPLQYIWDFGDGVRSSAVNPIHQFAEPGTYRVKLTASNAYGTSETTIPITVGLPPVADIIIDDSISVGESVVGKVSADNSVTDLVWQMGNGKLESGKLIEHRYNEAGLYTVTLIAKNDYGETRVSRVIEVKQAILAWFLPILFGGEVVVDDNPTPTYLRNLDPIDIEVDPLPDDLSKTDQLHWYINQARTAVGLPEVALVDVMSTAAQRHTDDMAYNRFRAHTGSDGSRPAQRLNAAGYTGNYAGEATAWGFLDPADAVQFWLSSASHRPIILNDQANEVGVGFTVDWTAPSIFYWTAEFGSTTNNDPYPDLPAPTPSPTPLLVPTPVATNPPFPGTTPVPIATATPQPTQPVIIITPSPTFAPTKTVEPTPTNEPTVEPTPTEKGRPTDEPTLTPTLLPTATPTEEATATPTPTATEIPTETPPPLVTETPTPPPSLTPSPTPTQVSVVVEDTPTPNPLNNPGSAVTSFVESLWQDPTGERAKLFATDNLDAQLTQNGAMAVLQLPNFPSSYAIYARQDSAEISLVWVRLTETNGTTHERLFTVLNEYGNWRVDLITLAE